MPCIALIILHWNQQFLCIIKQRDKVCKSCAFKVYCYFNCVNFVSQESKKNFNYIIIFSFLLLARKKQKSSSRPACGLLVALETHKYFKSKVEKQCFKLGLDPNTTHRFTNLQRLSIKY